MHKKDVLIANQRQSSFMGKQRRTSSGSLVESVIGPISGKRSITVSTVDNIGLNYGLRRGIQFDS